MPVAGTKPISVIGVKKVQKKIPRNQRNIAKMVSVTRFQRRGIHHTQMFIGKNRMFRAIRKGVNTKMQKGQ